MAAAPPPLARRPSAPPPPLRIRRQASDARRANIEKLRLLLEIGFVPFDLQEEASRAAKRARKDADGAAKGAWWSEWGTLLDRKVAVKESKLGGGERGLFAGVRFAASEVITLYGGRLLSLEDAKGSQSDRIVRLQSASEKVYVIDGSHWADGISQLGDDGLYMPAPGDSDRGCTGAGALARDSSKVAGAVPNAKLVFKPLGRDMASELLPKVPMLVALRPIMPDEEIVFDFSRERWYSSELLTGFLQSSSVVLRLGELVNKLEATAVVNALQKVLASRKPIQVAFLQGATPLQTPEGFKLLCALLTRCPVWSLNLGEIEFSEAQHERLVETLKTSSVTHMFYDEKYCGAGRKKKKSDPSGEAQEEAAEEKSLKEELMDTIRDNRKKHALWKLSNDSAQNAVIKEVTKNWFNPLNHGVNVAWINAHRAARLPTLRPLDMPLEGNAAVMSTTAAAATTSNCCDAAAAAAATVDDDDDDEDSMSLRQRMEWLKERLGLGAATATPSATYRSLSGASTGATYRSLGAPSEDVPSEPIASGASDAEHSMDAPVEDRELGQRLAHAMLLAAEPHEWGAVD